MSYDTPSPPPAESPSPVVPVPDADGTGAFDRGVTLLRECRDTEALACFRWLYDASPGTARYRSYYGLLLARVEHRFQEAIDLCASAAKQEFFNPDLYLNLARVNLVFGFKAEGLRHLRRGQMIDPSNRDILGELALLGARSSPVLAFLPRRHVVNRLLGSARHLLLGNRRALA